MYRYMGLITYWEIYASLSGLCIQIRDPSCKITKSLTLRNQSETAIYKAGQGTGHCPAGIFKNIISIVTKNEEAGHGPIPCPFPLGKNSISQLLMSDFTERCCRFALASWIRGQLFLPFIVKFVLKPKQINTSLDYFLYLCNVMDVKLHRVFGHQSPK